ncbi:MAG TPA: 30S ribosomal protein S16, partial [Cyclobacteriaceae bacterium]|nr:30S ribosomal protein S16 [Cyclobacteriaceae bacterium]
MLSYRGIMLKKHLQIGVVKGAITQEQADKKLADWLAERESKNQSQKDNLAKAKQDTAKARKAAETKIKEARAEAIRKKAIVVEAAPVEAPAAEGEASSPAEEQA